MSSKRKERSAVFASGVAVLLLAGCGSDDDGEGTMTQSAQLTCLGGNECAGLSECAGGPGMSGCEGLNECKGQGWSYVASEAECEKNGGTLQSDDT